MIRPLLNPVCEFCGQSLLVDFRGERIFVQHSYLGDYFLDILGEGGEDYPINFFCPNNAKIWEVHIGPALTKEEVVFV
jgi:hypothetical protein